jgi:hypothetical protein
MRKQILHLDINAFWHWEKLRTFRVNLFSEFLKAKISLMATALDETKCNGMLSNKPRNFRVNNLL